ncbi:MAG: Mur ligase family protein, partial [Butyrivibrio sp.]|nr:Mur ligase family protein [Butyrivibrio sp.]
MDYTETRAYLKSLERLGSVPGLDSIAQLLGRFGNPQKNTRFVHISGTNGKGSVGAFVTSVLSEAGFRVGRYLSPAVASPLEIIQMNQKNISEEDFSEIISRIRAVCASMLNDGFAHPTRFELETAAALVFFAEKKCDLAVVECGMGGLLDATNIIENTLCAVITPISAEHTAFLGNTVWEIARHKAGIIKRGAAVVYAAGDEAVNRIIESKVAEYGCHASAVSDAEISWRIDGEDSLVLDYKKYRGARIGLRGIYQAANAALALECIDALRARGCGIPEDAVYAGLAKARWFGRFERIGRKPDFIIDGAHNPAGAKALAES